MAEYCILNSSLISAANGPFHDRAVGLVYCSFTALPKWSDDIEKSIEFLAKTANFD